MQLSKTVIAAIALMAGVEACKCVNGGANDSATQTCCSANGGNYNDGDCAAGSISEHLSGFRNCCEDVAGDTSDCDFPDKREATLVNAKMPRVAAEFVAVRTAGAIATVRSRAR